MADDSFGDFLNALETKPKKGELDFKAFSGTDIRLASHVPYGIPTRIPQLDLEIGRPGYPAGRTIELYGFEHSGKSCAALAAMAACQRKGGTCVWIDAEFAWDSNWARRNGVDPERVAVIEAHTVEAIFNAQDKVIKAHQKVGSESALITVVDSITAVPSMESIKKEYGEVQKIGTDARAIRNGMRKISIDIAENNILAMYINHLTAKTAAVAYGAQSQSAGGHALKFWSSVRIKFDRVGTVWEGKDENKKRRGMEVGLTVEKNKVAATSKPKIKAKLLENGFDLYDNLFEAMIEIEEMDKVNNTTFFFKPGEIQLTRKEWRAYVDDRSDGIDVSYDWFLSRALEKGYLRSYK